jgi:uncharacterized FlgJ-related protein
MILTTIKLAYALLINPLSIKYKIQESGIKYKEIVYAQAIEESGHFKSRRAKECNNIFGIKISKHRLQNGKSNGYGCYQSIDDCIEHYQIIQSRAINNYHIRNKKDYLHYLKRIYAKNPHYVKHIQSIIKTNK